MRDRRSPQPTATADPSAGDVRSTPEPTIAEVAFEWHCRRMREHMRGDYYGDELPKPCPDCYSLRITTERIPFHFAEPSRPHRLEPVTDAA